MPFGKTEPWSGFEAAEEGNYNVSLEDYEVKTTKADDKLMFQLNLHVNEVGDDALDKYAGRSFRDWVVLGTKEDPNADEEKTLDHPDNNGVRKILAIARATQIDINALGYDEGDPITLEALQAILDSAIGIPIIADVKKRGDQNNINGYFTIGERQPGLRASSTKGGKRTKPQPSGAAKALRDRVAAAKRPTVKPAVVEVTEEEDESDAPVVAEKRAAPATKPAAAKVGKVAKGEKILCPMDCKEKILISELAEHVKKCTGVEVAEDEVETEEASDFDAE